MNARLALARLWRDQLGDPATAERLFLEARGREPTEEQEVAIANGLIDLYHASGRRGRELAELARLAARFPESETGKRARAALKRLKGAE